MKSNIRLTSVLIAFFSVWGIVAFWQPYTTVICICCVAIAINSIATTIIPLRLWLGVFDLLRCSAGIAVCGCILMIVISTVGLINGSQWIQNLPQSPSQRSLEQVYLTVILPILLTSSYLFLIGFPIARKLYAHHGMTIDDNGTVEEDPDPDEIIIPFP